MHMLKAMQMPCEMVNPSVVVKVLFEPPGSFQAVYSHTSHTEYHVCRDHLGYYEALGLEPGGASLADIKGAFRQAALMWHPDKQKVLVLKRKKINGKVTAVLVNNVATTLY